MPLGGPVVVEGVSATDVRLGVPWDVTLWVDVPRPSGERRIRARRDGPELLDRWLTDWMPSEEAYAAAQRPRERVDAVVEGRDLQLNDPRWVRLSWNRSRCRTAQPSRARAALSVADGVITASALASSGR